MQQTSISEAARANYGNPIICIISSKFCKKNFALECISGHTPIRVVPLRQGGHPCDVRVGLETFQNTILESFSKKQ